VIQSYKNTAFFDSQEEIDLLNEIEKRDEILLNVHETIFSHILVNYAFVLSKKFSAFYQKVSILQQEEAKKILSLKLILRYRETQKIVFDTLGIKLPTKM
jgi:arginyl-tRNA synthetase